MNQRRAILQEATPCDGCIHVAKCGDRKLACDAFAIYVNDGSVNWDIPRLPTRRTYSQTMRIGTGWNAGYALMRGINKKLKERALA
jgi:hypothetical protein